MKTYCPNCDKETECEFRAELYWCSECDEDFASYEKYWKKQACAAVKHMLEMTSFLRHIMTLGLLRGSPRLTTRALEILDGFEASGIEDTVTQDVEKSELADQVMEIIGAALSGDCQRYLHYDLDGNRYCKWGIVEKDIRAALINSKTSLSVKSDELRNYGDEVMEIIAQALSGDCKRYLNYDLDGHRYCKWGIVEKDIRALFETEGEMSEYLLDNGTLEYAAKWIENSLIGEINERVIEFGKNMAMSIRAAKGSK